MLQSRRRRAPAAPRRSNALLAPKGALFTRRARSSNHKFAPCIPTKKWRGLGHSPSTCALEGFFRRDVVDNYGDRRVANIGRNETPEALLQYIATVFNAHVLSANSSDTVSCRRIGEQLGQRCPKAEAEQPCRRDTLSWIRSRYR